MRATHLIATLAVTPLLTLFLAPDAQAWLPWKTDQWQVACEHKTRRAATHPNSVVGPLAEWQLRQMRNSRDYVNRQFGGDRQAALAALEQQWREILAGAGDLCDPSESDLLGRIDEQLEWSSRWLEPMGFSGPALGPDNPTIESRVFPGSLTDCLEYYCASVSYLDSAHGLYNPNNDRLRIGLFVANALVPSDEFRPGEKLGSGNSRFGNTPTHELFHSIQFGYDGVPGQWQDQGWIIEGTATYVGVVAGRLLGTLADPELPHREYDYPLHVPPGDGNYAEYTFRYGSWYFWDFLGTVFTEGDGVAYLESIFRHDLSQQGGLVAVHSALEMNHPTGLYDLYPEFVQERLLDDRHFGTVSQHAIQPGDREVVLDQQVEPMAANAYRVEYDLGGAPGAGLSVRLAEDHPDLHLVVDRERADTVDGDGSERNVWRTRVSSSGEVLVRVANTAPDPVDSEERSFDLELRLVPLEPCSQESMVSVVNEDRTYLGPFRAGQRFADPAIPEQAREFLAGQTQQLEPGTGALRLSGLVYDDGVGCTGHVGATSLTGRLMAGDESAQDEYVARMEEMAKGMEALLEQAEGAEQTTPEAAREMAEASSELQEAFSSDAAGHQQSVVFAIYSPNAWVWQSGLLSEAEFVKHSGTGGWRANSAAHFVIHLDGVGPDEIQEGGVYEASARGVPMGEMDDSGSVPTPNGFYTRWSGEFAKVPYPPPRDARAARRQEEEKARCRHQKQTFTRMRNSLSIGGQLTGEGMEKTDCNFRGTAFDGHMERVFGRLEGQVMIEEMTGAEIHGRFELSGSARVERTEFEFRYNDDGLLIGDRERSSSQDGPLRIEGELRAPNQRHGQARFGWEAIVID